MYVALAIFIYCFFFSDNRDMFSVTSSRMEPPSYTSTPGKRRQIQISQEVAAPKCPTYRITLNNDFNAETLTLVIFQKTNQNVKIIRTVNRKRPL